MYLIIFIWSCTNFGYSLKINKTEESGNNKKRKLMQKQKLGRVQMFDGRRLKMMRR